MTRWISHHIISAAGVGEIHEIGTLTNGTGKFSGITGIFYTQGTAGPGMSGDQKTFLWLGSRQGLICGLSSALTAMPAAPPVTGAPQPSVVPFRR